MAVIVNAEVPGQTAEGYDGMMGALGPLLRDAKGFIAHGAAPDGEVWHVFEIWESAADATDFFAKYVQPNLPPGIKPKRTLRELHNLVLGRQDT